MIRANPPPHRFRRYPILLDIYALRRPDKPASIILKRFSKQVRWARPPMGSKSPSGFLPACSLFATPHMYASVVQI